MDDFFHYKRNVERSIRDIVGESFFHVKDSFKHNFSYNIFNFYDNLIFVFYFKQKSKLKLSEKQKGHMEEWENLVFNKTNNTERLTFRYEMRCEIRTKNGYEFNLFKLLFK